MCTQKANIKLLQGTLKLKIKIILINIKKQFSIFWTYIEETIKWDIKVNSLKSNKSIINGILERYKQKSELSPSSPLP